MNQQTPAQDMVGAIAVIGMSGRFPGARNLDELWRNLRDGVESVSSFSDEELLKTGADPAMLDDPNFVKAGAVLDDIESFDARFFGITPTEAESMDPQQRLFLECAWHALEDAGYDPAEYQGRIGVYAGTGSSTYLRRLESAPEFISLVGGYQVALGNDKDFLTTHVSYKLNLRGPSIVVQSACSTSLVAVHLACQSLLDRQCELALAGGVNIKVPQVMGYFFQEEGIFSPDGHCRPFDAKAQGLFSGNGVGIVLLKRYVDAVADGDCIYAVIRGSAMNNDGALKVGYTAPSVDGQAQVVAMAHAVAGVDPETITYIEAHGTATPIGDPIEIAALTQAFRLSTDKKNFCAIGSIKSNFGHLDSAAGVAALIKAVLALKNRWLPPSLNFAQPNPAIDFANSPFYVNTKLTEWKVGPAPRRAGVSSFGIGGTNVHAVLEEAPSREDRSSTRTSQLLLLSAKTHPALESATTNIVEHLKRNRNLDVADLAYTLQVGRSAFVHRRMVVVNGVDDAIAALEAPEPPRVLTEEQTRKPSIAFLFPGHGSEYVHMGVDEYRTEPTFREMIDRCSEIVNRQLGIDLRRVLYPKPQEAERARRRLAKAAVFQPALFAVDYALAKLWMEWGIQPDAMIGHSTGEYVAACLAGVFSLEDALMLLTKRGELMDRTPKGAMLVVPLSESDLRPLLGDSLSIAAVNAPSICAVSGTSEDIEQLASRIADQGEECRRMQSAHAYHSAQMEPVIGPLLDEVKKVRLNAPSIPFVSNVTGDWATTSDAADPNYWAAHLRHTVRFSEGIGLLLKEPNRILLEVGPGGSLSRLAATHLRGSSGERVFSTLRHSREDESVQSSLLLTLGRLWLKGVHVNWSGFYAHEDRNRIRLPLYPFEAKRYWIEQKPPAHANRGRASGLRMPEVADWFYIPSWKRTVPPVSSSEHNAAEPKLCWMLFADKSGLAHDVSLDLQGAGQMIITVLTGDSYRRIGDSTFVLNPSSRADYDDLFSALKTARIEPNRIAHFWSISARDRNEGGLDDFEEAQRTGYISLLFLAQAIEKARLTQNIDIAVVSNHVFAAAADDVVHPEKATLLGPCQVIPQEYTNISCRCIDVDFASPERQRNRLLAELTGGAVEPAIAHRGNHRLARTYERVRLDRGKPVRRLREGGVYLLTGGMGSIGLRIARHLASSVKAKLIFVSRTILPERADWLAWLDAHPDDHVAAKIGALLEFESLGAEVHVETADIADQEQMGRVWDRVMARFGEIHGVFHLAADLRPGVASCPITNADEQMSSLQFRPKVYGTYTLAKLLRGRKIDFCVLFSSNASVLGGFGLVAYSAANNFLDSFAYMQNGNFPTIWVSTNWDAWAREGERLPQQDSIGQFFMNTRDSIEALDMIISGATTEQVVVSAGDLASRFDVWIRREFLEQGEDGNITSAHARPSMKSAYAPPENETQKTIVEIWQKLLGLDRVGIHDNFLELGGHSLLAMQLTSRLRKTLQVEVPVRTIFESPTPAGLGEALNQLRASGKPRTPAITAVPRESRRITFVDKGDGEIKPQSHA